MKKISLLPLCAVIATAAALLFYSAAVADGVREGLRSCAELLIPSLFPFMILAALVGSTAIGRVLSRILSLLLTPLTGLPQSLGAVYFMSMLGGFPVGARMLAQMLAQKEIDAETASRTLCCVVNAGPAFLISAVGVGLFGSTTAGLVLLCSQIFSSLILAAAVFRPTRRTRPTCVATPHVTGDVFVQSVRSAATGMLSICAFVIAFSALSALLQACGILPITAQFLAVLFPQLGEHFFLALLSGILEVTSGCIRSAALHSKEGFVLCAFLLSFSSMSILAQVKSCFSPESGVCFNQLYRSRLTGGLLSGLFALLGWQWIPALSTHTLSLSYKPLAATAPEMVVTTICFIAMFTILLLCPPCQKIRKKHIVNIFK